MKLPRFYGRADHRDAVGAGRRCEDRRYLPELPDFGCNLLQIQCEVRRDGRF